MLSITVKKVIAFCIIFMLVMSTSACGKDTSMVEGIADKKDSSTVQGHILKTGNKLAKTRIEKSRN